jgi:hypothetical protein
MQRGRTLGGPDRPDRGAQRLAAGVSALGAVQQPVLPRRVGSGPYLTPPACNGPPYEPAPPKRRRLS